MDIEKYMRIRTLLNEVEARHDVKVLMAVEAGSRAWGFPSPDSDWDVRFIYKHRPAWYMSVENRRDVIEEMHDQDLVDLSGWELRKALRLFRNWNPALMEWLSSPTVYIDGSLRVKLQDWRDEHFSVRHAVLHYLNLAFGNYLQYLKGKRVVRLKKYLYVMRALLRAEAVLQTGRFGSITLQDDMDLLLPNGPVRATMDKLLRAKVQTTELGEGDRIALLDDWIDAEMETLRDRVDTLPKVAAMDAWMLDELLFDRVMNG